MFVRTHRFPLPSTESFSSLQREMEGLFGRLLHDSPKNAESNGTWRAPVAYWTSADKVFLELELPGVTKDSIDLTIHNGVLRVAGERKSPEGERNYLVNERSYGTFERAIALPDDIDSDSVQAEFVDGVLKIELAKKPEAQPKKIALKG